MSIASEIKRITEARNAIATHLNSSWRITGVSTLEQIKNTITGIYGGEDITIKVGTSSVSIPKGYYNGNQKIEVQDSGGGTFELTSLTVSSLTTYEQNFLPGEVAPGADGFSSVTIPPVSSYLTDKVTATAANVLSGKNFVDKDGNQIGGAMKNNGSVTEVLLNRSGGSKSYTIPEGYHDGTGTVSIDAPIYGSTTHTLTPTRDDLVVPYGFHIDGGTVVNVLYVDEVFATPQEDQQIITPKNDNRDVCFAKTLKVGPIPSNYIKTEDANATASDILSGKTAYVNGKKVTGTIPNQAAKTITPKKSTQTAVAANVYTTGTITVGAIPNNYQDNTMLESNLDGISDKLYVVGSDGTAKYGTAITRSGEIAWDYTTSGSTFYLPTGIYQNSGGGTVSSYSVVVDANNDGELDLEWVEVTLYNEDYEWIGPFPAENNQWGSNIPQAAWIIPVEGNGYIKSIGSHVVTVMAGVTPLYETYLYQGMLYLVRNPDSNDGTGAVHTVQITNLVYEKSPAYINFNSLESALAAI